MGVESMNPIRVLFRLSAASVFAGTAGWIFATFTQWWAIALLMGIWGTFLGAFIVGVIEIKKRVREENLSK